jgi:peptide/nickel transport system substrate-binding protein
MHQRVGSLLAALPLLALVCACTRPAPDRVVVLYPEGPHARLAHESIDSYTDSVLSNVYEPLVGLDGNLAVRPLLAESWRTPDELTWVFSLRPGVRFHDGRPLTAAVAAAALERVRTDPRSRRRSDLSAVTRVEAPDDRTVVVHTAFAFATLPQSLASAPIFAAGAADPVGTGPYRVVRWDPARAVELEAYAGYAGPPPTVRHLHFEFVAPLPERLQRLSAGTADLVPLSADDDRERATVPASRSRLVVRRGLNVDLLGFDTARDASPYVTVDGPRPTNPLRDVRVRQAIALAIDRRHLATSVLQGDATVVDQIVVPEVFGHHPSLPPRISDPDAARRLLAAAGVKGFSVDLDYLRGADGTPGAVASAIAADLERVGIRVRPRGGDTTSTLARIERRDTSMFLIPWISNSGDLGITAEYLLHTPQGGRGSANGGGYANPELDGLLDEASRSLAVPVRLGVLHRVAQIVARDLPLVPLVRHDDVYAVAATLEFRPRLDKQVRGTDLAWSR